MKVAVIGRGFGANAMAPTYRALGWDVELVSSRDSAGVAAACAGDVDLISIHSPPFQHRELVLRALDAGRPILCDKPFGLNATEAREMRDAAKARGVLNMLNFEFRQQPARIKARELIASGAIGAPAHFSLFSYGSGMRSRSHGWLYDAGQGGGWIGAYGSHVIDGIRTMFATEVTACGGMVRTEVKQRPDDHGGLVPSTAEDSFSVWFTLANGATAAVDTGYAAAVGLPPVVQIMGSEGALTITNEAVVTLLRPGEAPQQFDLTPTKDNPFPSLPAWLALVTEAVREGRQITPSFDDGVAAAEAMEKLRTGVIHA